MERRLHSMANTTKQYLIWVTFPGHIVNEKWVRAVDEDEALTKALRTNVGAVSCRAVRDQHGKLVTKC